MTTFAIAPGRFETLEGHADNRCCNAGWWRAPDAKQALTSGRFRASQEHPHSVCKVDGMTRQAADPPDPSRWTE